MANLEYVAVGGTAIEAGPSYVRSHWDYLTTPGTYPGIDALRAVAVSLVVLYHFQYLPIGDVGVDLFFALSGFLIGGSILDKGMMGRFSFARFYGHRVLRILPVYYFVIALCVITKAWPLAFDWSSARSIATTMLFLQTTGPYFAPDLFTGLNPHVVPGGSWTLAIEETFYLLAPAVCIGLIYLARKRLALVTAGVSLIASTGIFVRLMMTSSFGSDINWFFASFIQFHSHYDELAMGVVAAGIARLYPRRHSAWFGAASAALVTVFLTYMISHPEFITAPATMTTSTIWMPTLLGLIGATAILACYWRRITFAPVVVLARISYPLYLIHIWFLETIAPYHNVGILRWLREMFGFDGRNAIMLVVAVALSYVVSLVVEYPFLQMYRGASGRTTGRRRDLVIQAA